MSIAGPVARIGTQDIFKSFGGVRAVRGVTFAALGGEVHAIVGENGAGKSTLMRLLGGAERPDSGTVLVDGAPVRFVTPAAALSAGIRTIHQEFTLLPDLDVVENIFLGAWLRRPGGLLDWAAMRTAAARILGDLGVALPLVARVADLSVPQQQLVEIAKALTSPARVLIMDEPSAVLAGRDLEQLFGVIERLTAQGTAVLYISHRLPEVFRVARSGDRAAQWVGGRGQPSDRRGDAGAAGHLDAGPGCGRPASGDAGWHRDRSAVDGRRDGLARAGLGYRPDRPAGRDRGSGGSGRRRSDEPAASAVRC